MTPSPPPSKRIKVGSSPPSGPSTTVSPSPQQDPNLKDADSDVLPSDHPDQLEPEADHCTICLQPFLDRTIIPVCAHEFCFECILLWSEQSRKCPLCSRSFEDSYLIHRIRSQYDYQKYYLPPTRPSPLPTPTGESRAIVLRHSRRERQWGHRARQEREEADQLERAISRRRWIYQHHLYAKHIASNQFTRYRPFPTPSQFTASPDLITRMTIFLRRELRVWPNLDVEFLTTYTIALMKAIDIRSESAIKLLSEFLDLDTPYALGSRRVNAEHFAHEIYSYLRSPYRDLSMYDKTAQYDTPPEISPPQEIERGSRWSAESSPSRRSRSQSNSRHQSPVPRRENNAGRSLSTRHARDRSAEALYEGGPSRRDSHNRSPRHTPAGQEYHNPRNHPPDEFQDNLRNGCPHAGGTSDPDSGALNTMHLVENRDNDFPIQPQQHFQGDKSQWREDVEEHAPKLNVLEVDRLTGVAGVSVDGPLEGSGDGITDDVDNVGDGSSANAQSSRKRKDGLHVHVHPRNRTLSESVQAYLVPSATPRHPAQKSKNSVPGGKRSTRATDTTSKSTCATSMRPSLLLRLTDGPTPGKGALSTSLDARGGLSAPEKVEQQHHRFRLQSGCILNHNPCSVVKHADATMSCHDNVDGTTRLHCVLPGTDDGTPGNSPSGDLTPGRSGFSPARSVMPLSGKASTSANVVASHALAMESKGGHSESFQTRYGASHAQGSHLHVKIGTAGDPGDEAQAQPGLGDSDDEPTLNSVLDPDLHGQAASLDGRAASLRGHQYGHNRSEPHEEVSTNTRPPVPSHPFSFGGDKNASTDANASGLETRLRTRVHLRVRLAAMKDAETKTTGVDAGFGSVAPNAVSRSGPDSRSESSAGLGLVAGLD